MNKTERVRVQRINAMFAGIPLACTGGTQSATIKSIANAYEDLRMAVAACRDALDILCQGESYTGQFDETITPVEAYIRDREAQGWT